MAEGGAEVVEGEVVREVGTTRDERNKITKATDQVEEWVSIFHCGDNVEQCRMIFGVLLD